MAEVKGLQNDTRTLVPQDVSVKVGDEDRGGYQYKMRLRCVANLATMTDAERLQAFIDHQKRRCKCYVQV